MDDDSSPREAALDLAVHCQADLERFWQALLGGLGFTHPRLWVVMVCEDGRPMPHVLQVDQLPDLPGDHLVHLLEICQRLDDEAGVAVLLSRPGRDGLSPTDKAWAAALAAAARTTGVSCWPLHVADDVAIRVVAPDDLADSA